MADRASSSSNSDLSSLFQELEQWEAVLKSELEVIHKLREFETVSRVSGDAGRKKTATKTPSRVRGPSP